MCELTKLEEQEIHEPQLVALNPKLVKLGALERLRITRANKLERPPPEIYQLSQLEELDVDTTRLDWKRAFVGESAVKRR